MPTVLPVIRKKKQKPRTNSSLSKKRSKLSQSAPNLNDKKLSKELRLKKAREAVDLPKLRPKTKGESNNQQDNVITLQ